ncbi:MAG: hypothetical protein HC893_08160, partial [Chloroflexaceae bacterium]|nr:hypothetical protein [Chloroflexaceae bacterium]
MAMQIFDQTINILSLLALSISVGLVIDDAIVVRENIIRYIEKGYSPLVAASKGTAEVALSVLAMTLTVIAVFVPVTFTTGTVGIIFAGFGIPVAAAIAISLFEAFTLAPMISARAFARTPRKEHKQANDRFTDPRIPEELREEVGPLGHFYGRVMGWTLRHRLITLSLGVFVIILSVLAAGNVKFAFFPSQDSGEFGYGFSMPPGTPLEVSDQFARQAEQILLADPEVEAVLTSVGVDGSAEEVEFYVKLHEEAVTNEVQERLRPQLAAFPDSAMSIASFNGTSTDVTNRPLQAEILTTGDLEDIIPIAQQIEAKFEDIPNLEDVDMTYAPGKPEIRFLINPGRANDFGFSNNDLAVTLRTLVDGDTAATFRDDGSDYDIVVRLEAEDRTDFTSISTLRVPLQGQMVPLASVASISIDESPTSIRRENRQTMIVVGGNNFGRNINEVQADMQTAIATIDLPPNVAVAFGGDTAEQGAGFESLLIAMGLSILFVYMVLASQFGSFFQPIVIMIAMPLSFVGAFLGLSLTGVELTIFGMVGMIMLMGLVVKNSILLVDFSNRLLDAGVEKNAAIQQASAVRLRPILMTSLTLILGALPSAIGLGEGGDVRRSLSVVVIGGMITSTLLTLLIVPSSYSILKSDCLRASTTCGIASSRRTTQKHNRKCMQPIGCHTPRQPPTSNPSTRRMGMDSTQKPLPPMARRATDMIAPRTATHLAMVPTLSSMAIHIQASRLRPAKQAAPNAPNDSFSEIALHRYDDGGVNKVKSSAYGVSFVLLCVAFILASCGLGGTEPEAEEAAPTVAIQVPTITLPTIEPADVADLSANLDVIATGSVEAAQDADLVFQINGTVDRILVEEGSQVQAQELLAILDVRSFDQNVRDAEAALVSARADQLALTEPASAEEVRAAQASVAQA